MTQTPRDLPDGMGVSTPHLECYQTATLLRAQLHARHEAIKAEHPDEGGVPFLLASMELRHLSHAIQVFAGLTAEASLNMYGMLALGEEAYYGGLERKPFPKKLQLIMDLGRERPIAPDSELIALGASLADMRNRIAHPKPREWTSKHAGESASNTATDLAAADTAIADVERFIYLLRTRDREYYMYLAVF